MLPLHRVAASEKKKAAESAEQCLEDEASERADRRRWEQQQREHASGMQKIAEYDVMQKRLAVAETELRVYKETAVRKIAEDDALHKCSTRMVRETAQRCVAEATARRASLCSTFVAPTPPQQMSQQSLVRPVQQLLSPNDKPSRQAKRRRTKAMWKAAAASSGAVSRERSHRRGDRGRPCCTAA